MIRKGHRVRHLIVASVVAEWICCAGALWAADPTAAVDTPPGRPPSDAIVVFDGTNTDALVSREGGPCRWPIDQGALVVQRDGGAWTKLHFRDAQIHAEFATPQQGPGNSGLYLHGLYEMQIFNSRGEAHVDEHSLGALYGMNPPLVNAARPPGQWQTFDIIFTAPRRGADGEVTAPGTITALLNGVLVQNHVEFRKHVSHFAPLMSRGNAYAQRLRARVEKMGAGPLQLQDHGSPVRFRNIWIRPLDDQAKPFDGGS